MSSQGNSLPVSGASLAAHTPGPWFAGPVQPEDDYGAPGGVSVGPYDIEAKFGGRDDYSPATFNDHYEDTIAYVSGCNHDPEANARLIAAAPTMHAYIAVRAAAGDREAIQIMEAVRGNA
jgi:hypothetical protein